MKKIKPNLKQEALDFSQGGWTIFLNEIMKNEKNFLIFNG